MSRRGQEVEVRGTISRMADIIDFDAGTILEGETLEEAGLKLYRLVLEVTGGGKTANEH